MMINDNDFQYSQSGDILVSACPVLVDEETHNNSSELIWGYYLCIENNSNRKISLVGKNWNIADDKGNRFSDDTVGFKGEIPELEPGECFEFTSMAPLNSENAVFYGSCKIKKEGQEKVEDVKIPTFFLTTPRASKSSMVH